MNSPSRNQDAYFLSALIVFGFGTLCVVCVRLLPMEYRIANFLLQPGHCFCLRSARLGPRFLLWLPFAVLAATDLYFLGLHHWQPSPFVYGSYAIYLLLGRLLARNSTSAIRVGAAAIVGSIQFFLVTNFGVWVEQAVHPDAYVGTSWFYPPTWKGLIACFEAGIPFFKGTVLSDLIFTAMFTAALAMLVRVRLHDRKAEPGQDGNR